MNEQASSWKVQVFLYALCILLLREWFLPIMELTDFDHSPLFFLYLILYFTLAFFVKNWWVGTAVQIVYIAGAVHYMYFDQVPLSPGTLSVIASDLLDSGASLLRGDISGLSNLFRTVLLFALIWMVAYLIRHWVEVKHSLFVFTAFTVLFAALIDTFSPYDASASIVRIMLFGLLASGGAALLKLENEQQTPIRFGKYLYLLLPLLAAVSAAGVIAFKSPVHPPAWPNPVEYLFPSAGGEREGGKASRSGYDHDDSQLGGAFIQDHQPVFEAQVDSRQYWRIETKDTYTSKGWAQAEQSDPVILRTNEKFIQNDETEIDSAALEFAQPLPYLVAPYGTQKVLYPDPLPIMHETEANRMSLLMGMQETAEAYETEFTPPAYTLSELKQPEMLAYETAAEQLNAYLQLPVALPERVVQLALSITEEQTAVYDKIKAVEQYFKENGFVYETQNVPYPEDEQDYVDQFLFETKRGYCDNFSTSMAVMLRASGIPARWAKGFAPGELSYKASGAAVYNVTNDEAHSWVEAYIPNIGWVPFEPTIGFSLPVDIENDLPEEPQKPEEELEKPEVEETQEEEKDEPKNAGTKLFEQLKKQLQWFFTQWWLYVSLAAVGAGAGLYAYSTRKKWLPRWNVKKSDKLQNGWEKFEWQYSEMLRQLHRAGIKKAPGMTLTQYAEEIDSKYGGERMRLLTDAYEKGIYGNDFSAHDWNQLNKVWEDLIIAAAS